jgi:hypothetical protein
MICLHTCMPAVGRIARRPTAYLGVRVGMQCYEIHALLRTHHHYDPIFWDHPETWVNNCEKVVIWLSTPSIPDRQGGFNIFFRQLKRSFGKFCRGASEAIMAECYQIDCLVARDGNSTSICEVICGYCEVIRGWGTEWVLPSSVRRCILIMSRQPFKFTFRPKSLFRRG